MPGIPSHPAGLSTLSAFGPAANWIGNKAPIGLDNIVGGPAQNVIRQYDENQSPALPRPVQPGINHAQQLAAHFGDAPTYASAGGMKGAGFTGVKRAK